MPLFYYFCKSKSVTGRKLQHIRGELFGVIGVESFGKMLIMSRGNKSYSFPVSPQSSKDKKDSKYDKSRKTLILRDFLFLFSDIYQ